MHVHYDVSVLSEGENSACNVVSGHYKYLADLLALDQCRPTVRSAITGISASIKVDQWKDIVAAQPDKLFVDWVVRGSRRRFRVGFDYSSHECSPTRRRMKSSKQYARVVSR